MATLPTLLSIAGARAGQQASAGATLEPFSGVTVSSGVAGLSVTITTTGYDHTVPGTGIDQVFADNHILIVDPNTSDNSTYDPIQQTFTVSGTPSDVTTILQNLQVTFPGAASTTVVVETDFNIVAQNFLGSIQSGPATTVFTTSPITPSSVYRFFDKSLGTEFLTSSAVERDIVKASRPDLVQETNDFGSVGYGSPNSQSVYRFFDTLDGSHFFTANPAEFNTVTATRPDLVLEPYNTFFEHTTPQTGDVPVYRFFNTTAGTHFFTGDATEYAALSTQGAAGYRADLKYEGIAFYAPHGTYV